MKTILFSLLSLFAFCTELVAQDIGGFWKSINDKTGKAECIVAVYEYQGKYYGRIVGTYGADGQLDDTIYAPKDRAPGVKGDPFYSGLDIIWGLQNKGPRYKGKIMDPQKGRVYNVALWVKDGNLIVRGELLFFGRNEVWIAAQDRDFTSTFKKPDVTQFIPVIHEVK